MVRGVKRRSTGVDPLFFLAERQATDYSRFPRRSGAEDVPLLGVLGPEETTRRMKALRSLDVDGYVAIAVQPSEDPNRPGARSVIRRLPGEVVHEVEAGPLYAAEVLLDVG